MAVKTKNLINSGELNKEFQWYQDSFSETVEHAFDDFFGNIFELKFVGLSKNINYLLSEEACFVTKAKLHSNYEIFFRLTSAAVKIILDNCLGEGKSVFNLNKITDLEAKVITGFNNSLYKAVKGLLLEPNPKELKRTNYDIVNLTFFIREKNSPQLKVHESGKIVVALPLSLLDPKKIEENNTYFSENDFLDSETFVKIFVGSTRFSLADLKGLDVGDLVIFENSNISNLTLVNKENRININLEPNMDILIPEENNGGDELMTDGSQNIWDSIGVDLNAEFDAVKVTLGDLKNIDAGAVVDIASLYDSKVTLKVEGRSIAKGTLVIVNDRYGVKVEELLTNGNVNFQPEDSDQVSDEENNEQDESLQNSESEQENAGEGSEGENEEEFDYSDFELEDENI